MPSVTKYLMFLPQVNKQFLVPGNGVQAASRRDTVGSVSDDDSKMVICEDRPPEANTDQSSSKAGKCGHTREPRRPSGHI